jgi:beta-glucosidase
MTSPGYDFPAGFLWGASTSAHQTEGNNVGSDLWALENQPGSPIRERSGDACDSLHRWPEDIDLVASLGLNSYRFSIEWARIEPAQGHVSRAMLAHYRAMIDGCLERSVTPVVTLHHFTSPLWFHELGGWMSGQAPALFASYVRAVLPILDGVQWVCTINEPNMLAIMHTMLRSGVSAITPAGLPEPDAVVTASLAQAHRAAREVLAAVGLRSGWTVACQNAQASPRGEDWAREWSQAREDQFLDVADGDDFIGVQAYTRTVIGPDGPLPPDPGAGRTLTGWEIWPQALAGAVRHVAATLPETPILVTENGIATDRDAERIDYTRQALAGLTRAIDDGIDVRGYLHWSLLDNYEWGSYLPTFGLVAVDRETFTRTVKPSGHWLGGVARANAVPHAG